MITQSLQPASAATCPWATTLFRLVPILQGHINAHPVNQGLHKPGHWSSSLSKQCIHIINHLQQHLQPDHTATPTVCTKHRDYPQFLDTLSPQTKRQLSLRTFNRNYTDRIQQLQYYTHTPFLYDSLNKTWYLNLSTCLCHLSSPLSINNTTYISLRDRHIYISPVTLFLEFYESKEMVVKPGLLTLLSIWTVIFKLGK